MSLLQEIKDKIKNRTLLEDIYYFFYWKIKNIRVFIKFRFFKKMNIIKITTLESDYWDTDTRLLHSCFQLLVDFIEIEKAHMQRMSEFYERGGLSWFFYKHCPWWLECLIFPKRSRELGLKYLEWEKSLPKEDIKDENGEIVEYGNPYQVKSAEEQMELYLWWKDTYPNRKDPMELSGWSAFCDKNRNKLFKTKKCENSNTYEIYDTLTEEEKKEERRLLDLTHKIEAEQLEEEKNMLKRLIDIKESLWT